MKTLTVYTPTYNRADTLARTYKSLCRQTSDDFVWLIVDDGSTDNTRAIVEEWQHEAAFNINYIYKENGGLHTGYNIAIANMDTEICVCCDSDDYLPDNAVEIIVKTWGEKKSEGLAGIIGLDFYLDNTPIGGKFDKTGPFHIHEMVKFHRGDTKIVCRSDLLKHLAPMPVFEGEKNFNPIYFFIHIDKDYKFYLINKNLCFVDYQPSGMSANILRQYRNSPKSFAQLRRLYMSMPYYSQKTHFRNAIHYVSSCIFSRQWNGISTSPRPLMCIAAIPLGIVLNLFIRYKTRAK